MSYYISNGKMYKTEEMPEMKKLRGIEEFLREFLLKTEHVSIDDKVNASAYIAAAMDLYNTHYGYYKEIGSTDFKEFDNLGRKIVELANRLEKEDKLINE